MNILPPAGRTPGVDAQEPHPGNALEAKLLELFPGAMLVEDEDGPPWTTTASGRYGRIDVRDVPLDDDPSEWAPKSTTAGRRSRGGVVSAEPDDDPRHEIDPDEVERLAARVREWEAAGG